MEIRPTVADTARIAEGGIVCFNDGSVSPSIHREIEGVLCLEK